ncbi:hypothetical protein SBBP2_1590007 [Burkholderiales bacterium]|jgi:hypothetical protein|nr:hypothetical protein SBBP2_1590007 [Burkholderiales bacterium]
MQTVIKDLPLNEEMDSNDMAAIQGGIIPTNVARPNVTSFKLPTFGTTQTPPTGGVSGGDPGSGGGGGYLDGPYGDDDLHEQD